MSRRPRYFRAAAGRGCPGRQLAGPFAAAGTTAGPVDVLLTIGDFATMTYLGIKALRHYHRIGLLVPADVDPQTGQDGSRWVTLADPEGNVFDLIAA